MKKVIIGVTVGVVVLLAIGLVVLFMNLDSLVKKGVETVGPQLTKTEVRLEGVSLSPFSGSGQLKGVFIGNPQGYKTASAFKMGAVKLAVKPASLTSGTIVVDEVTIQGPEITFEGTPSGANNLSKILQNIEAATGGKSATPGKPAAPAEKGAEKKFCVKELVFTGGKIHLSITLLGGKQYTVPLPELRVQNIGTPENGVTAAEMAQQIMKPLLVAVTKAAGEAATQVTKDVKELSKDLDKTAKGIKDLFKK